MRHPSWLLKMFIKVQDALTLKCGLGIEDSLFIRMYGRGIEFQTKHGFYLINTIALGMDDSKRNAPIIHPVQVAMLKRINLKVSKDLNLILDEYYSLTKAFVIREEEVCTVETLFLHFVTSQWPELRANLSLLNTGLIQMEYPVSFNTTVTTILSPII